MQLWSYFSQLTGKSFDELRNGPDGPLVLFRHDLDDTVVIEAWAVDGVEPPTEAQIKAALAAPEPPPTVAQLAAYAAAKRYAVETGGISVNGAPIATDRESQAMVGNAFAYVQAASAASVSYKTGAGFVTLTAAQIKAVALAVGAHVQACFAAEDAAEAGISASPPTITTYAQVDAAFADLVPAAPVA